MRIPHVENNPSKVQLSRISHVYFEHADLEKFSEFAHDFGFVEAERRGDVIYFRGYGRDPYCYVAKKSADGKPKFGGGAFVAASEEEFNKAAKIPGASPPKPLEGPGGGQVITFARPNGTFMHVIYEQEDRQVDTKHIPTETHEHQGPFNTPFEKPRLGQFQRYHPGPALIHKVGHYGYVCKEFDAEFDFYTSNFNLVPSDVLYHPQIHDMDVLAFIRLDLGKEYSDHHTFFMQRAPPEVEQTYVHHTSYEISDFDTQLLGHEWLAKKGWRAVWGVGRHVLGSQIFDYWADPSGFKIEHYADGDVVNVDIKTKRDVAGPISVWGPELPKDFGDDLTKEQRQ